MSIKENQLNNLPAAEALSFGQRLESWIDDPFASVIVGIVMPAMASTFVLSGIWALAVVN